MRNTVVTHVRGPCLPESPALSGRITGSVPSFTSRQKRVNGLPRAVKRPSGREKPAAAGRTVVPGRSPEEVTHEERCAMADLLYAVLLIAVFTALALTLRGLEKL